MKSTRDKRKTPQSVRRKGRNLCYAGWGLFALSMFLPAAGPIFGDGDPMKGWHCAWMVLLMLWPGNWNGNAGETLYFASFALTNLLLLASPFLLRKSLLGGKVSWLVPFLLAVATADVLSLARGQWLIGYYAWLASYGLVAAGSLCLLKAQKMRPTPTEMPAEPRPRTAQEMAAERELENYLRSV